MICSVILAAGKSTRMSNPKQLLTINGESLIKKTAIASINSDCDRTLVVTGAYAELVSSELKSLPVTIVANDQWETGISGSLKIGLEYLLSHEKEKNEIEALIIILCDQPFVDSQLICRLIEQYKSNKKGIVACRYGKTTGVPALFDRLYFKELLSLKGDKGARSIIKKATEDICTIAFPGGAIDIDTDKDFEFFLRSYK